MKTNSTNPGNHPSINVVIMTPDILSFRNVPATRLTQVVDQKDVLYLLLQFGRKFLKDGGHWTSHLTVPTLDHVLDFLEVEYLEIIGKLYAEHVQSVAMEVTQS